MGTYNSHLKPRLVGLCGDIGSGKSTVAQHLARAHGYQRKAFATLLKHTALDVFGPMGMESRNVFGTQEEKNKPIAGITDAEGRPQTGRRILEWLGTEGFRTIDPDVWVKSLLGSLSLSGERYVVEDVRFPNEFEALREHGGRVWEVRKIGGPDFGGRTGHESDDAWRHVRKDEVVEARAGDLLALRVQVDELVNGVTNG